MCKISIFARQISLIAIFFIGIFFISIISFIAVGIGNLRKTFFLRL